MKTTRSLTFCLILNLATLPTASCRKEANPGDGSYACYHSEISISRSGVPSYFSGKIDAFAYEDNAEGHLDSYQHSDNTGENLDIASRSGRKRFVIIANARDGLLVYNDILNYKGLQGVQSNLKDEVPESPLMFGQTRALAGSDGIALTLMPLMAQIRIDRFSVDFTGKSYSDMEFSHPRAYLVNVNGLCPVGDGAETESGPVEIINYGRLDETACRSMPRPDMLICDDVTGHPLYCYPCDGATDGLGRCTTRLVIEGEIDGVTYYYPINVGGGKVERGQSYAYDITITRPGMTDPDIPVDISMVRVNMQIENWDGYENETIYY